MLGTQKPTKRVIYRNTAFSLYLFSSPKIDELFLRMHKPRSLPFRPALNRPIIESFCIWDHIFSEKSVFNHVCRFFVYSFNQVNNFSKTIKQIIAFHLNPFRKLVFFCFFHSFFWSKKSWGWTWIEKIVVGVLFVKKIVVHGLFILVTR